MVRRRRCLTWLGLVCGAPQALPNLASRGSPMAYVFGYMGVNPAHAGIIKGAWPEGGADGYKRVQPIGPSPVVIHRDDLETVGWLGLGFALTLTTDPDPDPEPDPDPILNSSPDPHPRPDH